MIKRIDVIQLLRGIASLMVCLFHLKGLLNSSTSLIGNKLFAGGGLGVSVFFIISGFIMVYTTRKSDGSNLYVRNFMIKRLVRIIPLYYIMLLLWIFAYDTHLDYFSKDFSTLLKSLCFMPILDSMAGPAYGMPPLKVGWSLNYEIFFYLIFGLSLFLKRFRWTMLFGVFAILVLGVPILFKGFIVFDPLYNYNFRLTYFLLITNPMMIYFLMGVVIGLLYNSTFDLKNRWIKTGLLTLSISLFLILYFRQSPFIDNFFISLFICCSLVSALLFFNKEKGIRVPGMFVYLGDISYSLYLIHPTVIIVLPRFIRLIGLAGRLSNTQYFFLSLFWMIALSILSYELIEKRLLKRTTKILITPGMEKIPLKLQPIFIKE